MLKWATLAPTALSAANPGQVLNLVGGKWEMPSQTEWIIDPMNGEKFLEQAKTPASECAAFSTNQHAVPKSGLHNPIKNPERYILYGKVLGRLARMLYEPEVEDYFKNLIQRFTPKSDGQAVGEISIVRTFCENFSGDNPRFLAQGFIVPGDHLGQQSIGYRFPYGPVGIISPFNFPLEIPSMQLIGALLMGNRPLLKAATKTSAVMEQFLRLMIHCGMPAEDVDFINCGGRDCEQVFIDANLKLLQFTGSAGIAERLCEKLRGKVKLEDAGFDWKVLGPDVTDFDYVAWTSDRDSYEFGGQKCSAQSILFAHENWVKAGIFEKIAELAARRSLDNLTNVPILSCTNEEISEHTQKCAAIPGARVLFGGNALKNHSVPDCYAAFEPTAVYVPINEILNNFELITTEIFGPFQIVTDFQDSQLDTVLQCLETMDQHLTAAVASNDIQFQQKVLANTVNGTTYAGIRARTTGAPQNHWFGPGGDCRGAGIGTEYAIRHVWSYHREIIMDQGPVPQGWTIPPCV